MALSMIKNNVPTLVKVCLMLLPLVLFKSIAADYSTPLKTLDNQTTSLSKFVGSKPVYVKFWASWCKPCMQEMPHLQESFDKYGNSVHVLAVNIDLNETDENIQSVVEKFGLTLPIYKDDNARLARELEFIGTPYHVLIDKDGDVVHKGNAANEDLNRKLHILAQQQQNKLPTITLQSAAGITQHLTFNNDSYTALYLTSTWCDWYLEDTRPIMSKACIDGQHKINQMAKDNRNIHWQLLVNHLWTASSDLKAYVDKYKIKISADVDTNGDAFFSFKVKTLPTLILFKGAKVIGRTSDVNDFEDLIQKTFK